MIQMWQPIALLLQQSIQSCNYRKYRPHIKLQINTVHIFLKNNSVQLELLNSIHIVMYCHSYHKWGQLQPVNVLHYTCTKCQDKVENE